MKSEFRLEIISRIRINAYEAILFDNLTTVLARSDEDLFLSHIHCSKTGAPIIVARESGGK